MGASANMTGLSLGFTRQELCWSKPLPPGFSDRYLELVADDVSPLWDILGPSDTSAAYVRWSEGFSADPLDTDGYAEIPLAGRGPEAFAAGIRMGLRRARGTGDDREIGWESAGPVFARALRVVIPDGVTVSEALPMWLDERQLMCLCTLRAAPLWRGLRTVWVELPLAPGLGSWGIGATMLGTLTLDLYLTLNVWLDSDPPICGPLLGGVRIEEWRRLNQAFLAEVLARLEERWGPPRWAPPW